MRQITVTVPEGAAKNVCEIAFAAGISEVSVSSRHVFKGDGSETSKACLELEVSTPQAKSFLDRLAQQSFLPRDEYAVAVRQPRSLASSTSIRELTVPLVEPSIDVCQELWQFSHVTYGFVGRILIGGLLLGYGIVEFKLLSMIAGLLFLPLLPLMLSVGFGLCCKQWKLALQGVVSLIVALLLLIIAGVVVGTLTNPPVRFSEFSSLMTGLLVSTAVGVAGSLATADDVGRREMIGLAATAQVAIVPTWLGCCLLLGFPLEVSLPQICSGLLVNIISIVIISFITYKLMGMRSPRRNED